MDSNQITQVIEALATKTEQAKIAAQPLAEAMVRETYNSGVTFAIVSGVALLVTITTMCLILKWAFGDGDEEAIAPVVCLGLGICAISFISLCINLDAAVRPITTTVQTLLGN